MALSDILQKIAADYAEQAQKITEAAMNNAENFVREVEESERKNNEVRWEKALVRKQDALKKASSKARSQSQQRLLAEKRDLIEQAFADARAKMVKMSDGDYVTFLVNQIEGIDCEEGEIIAAKGRLEDTKKAVNKLQKHFKVSEGDFDGGFIFREKDVEVNATFDRLFDDLRRRHETEVAQILFG